MFGLEASVTGLRKRVMMKDINGKPIPMRVISATAR
jgi:hypothetical protein